MTTPDPHVAGTPDGISPVDVDRRAELASFLGKEIWPADSNSLLSKAEENGAPDGVLSSLRALPHDQKFESLSEVWQALGGGSEQSRF